MPPTVPTRPAGGASVATAWGQWVHDWFKKRDMVRPSAALSLTTTSTDVPGLTMTVGTGWFMVLAVIDFNTVTAGPGILQADLLVDGVAQTGSAFYRAEASAAAGRATVSQIWLVNITSGSGVLKIQGKAGTGAGGQITTASALAVI